MDRTSQLLSKGYKSMDSCYDDASEAVERLKNQGYKDIVVQRVRTDTKGMKMFLIWAKEIDR